MHTRPVVLLIGVKLGTFHGTCVGAQNNTKIVFDPQIPETNSLKTRFTILSKQKFYFKYYNCISLILISVFFRIVENKDYAENVIKKKLYEKQKQEVRVPKEKHIRQINQVLNIQHTVKNCWVKATATIKDNQRLYTTICPNCDNPSGAPMGIISTCNYCGTSGKAPKPGLNFVINLADITGTLQAVIQNEYAEKLLRCSADEVYHNHLAVNTTLQTQVLYARLRIFKIKESAFGFELTAFTPDQKTCDMMIEDTPTKAVTTPATYPAITSSPSQQGSTTKSQTHVDTPTSVAEDSEYVSVQDAEKKGTAVKRTLTHDIERASKKTRFPPSDQQ
ncbi:OLC1v1037653C1 [Oldenlandia corymbosa var. corymbosa]|uniref:OLC1v1037653C1 n=1 Tax=Oldenlandia corymbosa var. corymbosa TaxID=529605 RepID=A0AAV1CYV4_OLDCO|nr:OLC1v1037653C1 [Oldenlandia corymbosa var. corymbosa]